MLRNLTTRVAVFTLAIICAGSFALMLHASQTDSAIDDELAHIPAGYGYVHNLDYRLNPEHPPLIKALAMLPVLFLRPNFPTDSSAWQNEVNGQWDMGAQFLYQSGNNADLIVQVARIMPILLTLLAIIFIYLFARALIGPWWALLPSFLFAFDPTVLAHGHYVTTDVGAALGVLVASYYFSRFLAKPSRKNLFYAGIAFGIAQLTKLSAPLLIPLFIFITIVLWWRNTFFEWNFVDAGLRFKTFGKRLASSLGKVLLVFAIGYALIVYPVYFLFTAHYPVAKQVSDTQALLGSFAGGPAPAGQLCRGMRCVADLDIGMARSPVLRPFAEYLLGILMVTQRADGGNTIYFLGMVRDAGGWLYFPVLFLLKEPLPTLILILIGLGLALFWMIKRTIISRGRVAAAVAHYLKDDWTQFKMASFIILYWGYSMRSPLNIGIRHLMPTIPFIYILTAVAWKKWVTRIDFTKLTASIASFATSAKTIARMLLASTLKYVFLVIMLLWLLVESLIAAPYFLSYFNEIGGGTAGGYHYVTDSNYDWGQDLLRLKTFVTAHPEIDRVAIDYFGGGNPHYYFGDKEVDWNSAKGNPADQGIHWFVVSINQLQNATQPLSPGKAREPQDEYSWLVKLRPPVAGMGNVPPPDFRAGTSLFIYHL